MDRHGRCCAGSSATWWPTKGKGSFAVGILLRFVSVVGLISLPWLTGHAITVISSPGGTKADLAQTIVTILVVLIVYGICSVIAGASSPGPPPAGSTRCSAGCSTICRGSASASSTASRWASS